MAAGFTQTGNRDAVDAAIGSSIFSVGEKRRCTRAGKTTVEGREDVNQHVDTDIFVTLLIRDAENDYFNLQIVFCSNCLVYKWETRFLRAHSDIWSLCF